MAENQFSNIKLLIGLGNPEKVYERTYHNVGRLFADYRLKNVSPHPGNHGWRGQEFEDKIKFRKPTAPKNFEYMKTEDVIFVRPLLFMNESGAAVQAALKFFNLKPEKLLVIHDDSDIEIGSYKISFGRGAGGHHGAESIIQKLKTKDFWRLRIGIRRGLTRTARRPTQTATNNFRRKSAFSQRESASRIRASEFVLKKISPRDEKILYSTFKNIEVRLFGR